MLRTHNRHTIRLKNWDYSSSRIYFITICTQNRECILGNINANKMQLNEFGNLTNKSWLELPNKFKNIDLDQFQIMPNHIHGIIVIRRGEVFSPDSAIIAPNKNGQENPAPTLGKIIAYFKYQSTKQINQSYVGAGVIPPNTPGVIPPGTILKIWQRNYYERIIRNEREFENIKKYIYENPQKWNSDENNPQNL